MSVITLTNENFESEVLNETKPVLVDFFATWCGPCKIMSPIIDEIAEESDAYKVCKLDVDEADEIAEQYGIMSIPTVIVFKNGEAAHSFVGVTDKDAIKAALN